jgi:hypothetical protein
MRPAWCTKRGSDVPFKRINTDPFDSEDDLTASFADDDMRAILPSLVSIVDKSNPTMRLLKETPKKEGVKRTSAQASLDAASGRDTRPRTTSPPATPISYSLKLAREVADELVAMHPDGIGGGYDTWKRVMFGAIHTTGTEGGAPPEFVQVLKEFTRIRDGERDQELARIAAGAYVSQGGITMGSLVRNKKEFPAAYTDNRVSNADPLPGCRDILVTLQDVVMFTRFETFLRYANYLKTSWKWLVQLASYVVPKLKEQVYDMIQDGYEGITKEDFDVVWDGGQHSEIYEFAFKRYLADIVRAINSTTPLVGPTVGEPDGEATTPLVEMTAGEPDGVVPTKDVLEDIHTLLEIVKTTASHSSKSTHIADLMCTGVLRAPTLKCFPEWDHVTGQADGEPDWDDIQQSLETLQTQLIKASSRVPPLRTAVTTVSHVGPSKLKHPDRQRKSFTKEQVLNYLAKTSASVHYFEAPEVIRKAVSGALKGQKNAAKDTKELLRLFTLLHATSSKTGTAYK